jgi:hypothetical protein
MRKLALLMALLAFSIAPPAAAQSGGRAVLTTPDTSQFPTITAYLTVTDANGAFVHGLTPAGVTVLEDGQSVQAVSLSEEQSGVRIFVAVNAAPGLALRDSNGVSRYDQFVAALSTWAESGKTGVSGQYALVTSGSSTPAVYKSAAEWLAAFNAYKPDLRNAKPSLEALSLAISQAASPAPQAGTVSAVLYITQTPEQGDLAELANLATRARDAGVPVFVWMVSSVGGASPAGGQALSDLAAQTGGKSFAYSGSEAIPDLSADLSSLGGAYRIQYPSAIRTSGQHSLAVKVNTADVQVTSPEQAFKLDIQPPNPMFVSPPVSIVRRPPEGSRHPMQELNPSKYPLKVLVEFPDGHPRALKSLVLYADGKPVAQSALSGSGVVMWDLSSYSGTQQVMLKLEAVDELGLKKDSLEMPVQVSVVIPPQPLLTILADNSPILGGMAVLLAGVLLTLIMYRGGRRPSKTGHLSRQMRKDPVTQPVSIRGEEKREKKQKQPAPARLHWPRHGSILPVYAVLVRLHDNNEPTTGRPIQLSARETTLGRDPTQASCVIDAPGVEALHARISRKPDGSFILSDLGSVAGTWVNYAPVSSSGARLEHGDLIHIGRVAFRFQLTRPDRVRRPQVTPYQDDPFQDDL